MRIVDAREMTVPIASAMRNAVIDFSQMTVSLVALVSDVVRDGRSLVGYGFNSNGRYGQGGLLRERLFPRLAAAEPESLLDSDGGLDPLSLQRAIMANEKPGGHGERAVAAGIVDMAAWDLAAKVAELPLHAFLARRCGRGRPASTRVAVYAAGGYYYPDGDLASLRAEMRGYLELGYTRVKMKIGGAPLREDLRRIEAVLDVVGSPAALAVDANGRFDGEGALRCAEALAPYRLAWYEEPCDPLDFEALAGVAERYSAPLATGENLLSLPDTTNLLRYGGLRADRDLLQMDPALSYGLVEYMKILDVLPAYGWERRSCLPHGGHQLNLSIAAGLGLGGIESYPGVFAPFGGFADAATVEDGFVEVSEAPGIGLELKAALRPLLAELAGEATL